MRYWFLSFFSVFFFFNLQSQSLSFQEEMRFGRYLLNKGLHADAMKVFSRIDTTYASAAQKDSFYYLLGWSAYQAKELDKSTEYLLKVSPATEYYNKSLSFAAYNLAFQKKYQRAGAVFEQIPWRDSVEQELMQLELSGLALLMGEFEKYEILKQNFTYSSYIMQQEEKRMDMYRNELLSFRKKSPFLAGMYSAVLPGAGKWYAGKKKQGIASFLPIASLAAITYEAYRKRGVKDARFITFGSLFSLFYVGNIWGSVFAVKVKQNEFKREYENKILFDMHIPLRNFYN